MCAAGQSLIREYVLLPVLRERRSGMCIAGIKIAVKVVPGQRGAVCVEET